MTRSHSIVAVVVMKYIVDTRLDKMFSEGLADLLAAPKLSPNIHVPLIAYVRM